MLENPELVARGRGSSVPVSDEVFKHTCDFLGPLSQGFCFFSVSKNTSHDAGW
jgi:hypothetical protein